MAFLRFLCRYQVRLLLAMTGHIATGIIGIVEHIDGHSLTGWLLFGACWLLFYLAAFQFHRENEKRHETNKQEVLSCLGAQTTEIKGLRALMQTRQTQLEHLLETVQQLNRENELLKTQLGVPCDPEPALQYVAFGPGVGSLSLYNESGCDRVNRPANWSVTASVFRMSWNAAIFNSGRSKPSPSMSTQTTIRDSPARICLRIVSRSRTDFMPVCSSTGLNSGYRS
jgi:hypothetical protein